MNKCKNKFVIIGLTLKNTPSSQKKIIKQFFKSKHTEYPNMIFIYYEVSEDDLGKKISLLKNKPEEYPYLYHIYDIEKILVTVSNVNIETLHASFNAVKHHYDNDKMQNELSYCEPTSTMSSEARPNLKEKITILKNKSEEYSINILQDIKKRKKLESK
jgi:hypothetical protein